MSQKQPRASKPAKAGGGESSPSQQVAPKRKCESGLPDQIEVPEEIQDAILKADLPPAQKEVFLKGLVQISHHQSKLSIVSGTLPSAMPPAELLEGYERVKSGLADRAFTMAEKQSSHRQEMEKMYVGSQMGQSKVGQWMAFILSSVIIVAASIISVLLENAWPFGVAVGGVTGGGLGVFFLNKQYQQKNAPVPPHQSSKPSPKRGRRSNQVNDSEEQEDTEVRELMGSEESDARKDEDGKE